MIQNVRSLFLGAALVFSFATFAQKPDIRFKNISVLDGLSNSNIHAIEQDHQGFMWFGSPDGLNKYDGYDITVYKHDPADSFSLPHNYITFLFEDSKKNLWVATLKGIARYDRDLNRFDVYEETIDQYIPRIQEDRDQNIWAIHNELLLLLDKEKQHFVRFDTLHTGENIERFYQDKRGAYWVATSEHIYIYDKKNKKFDVQPQLDVGSIRTIHEDRNNNLWFASIEEGLILYDRDTKSLTKYQREENNPNSLPKNPLHGLIEDEDGRLWIGVMNGGLSIFDVSKNKFYNYESDKGDPESLTFNSIHYLFKDSNNQIWLGIFNGGVDFVEERKFGYLGVNLNNPNSLSDNNVATLFEDSRGDVWIGTDGGGLNIYDPETKKFKHFNHNPDDPGSISSNVVLTVEEDRNGDIWLGYWKGGMDKYDRRRDRFIHYKYSEHKSAPTSEWTDECIRYLYEDKQSNLWAATANELNLFDRKVQKFIRYTNDGSGSQNYVSQVFEDSDSVLWVATWGGLFVLDRSTKTFTQIGNNGKGPSDDIIYVIFEDSRQRIWVGTARGLNLYNKTNNTFTSYHVQDGLPSESIYSIREDDAGNLWLGTSKGLSQFDLQSETFRNYDVYDGLQGNEFKFRASLTLRTGELMFGGLNGINLFNPENVTNNQHVPPVVFTGFKIFNKPAPIGKDSPLKKHISQTEQIILSYEDAVFTIEFAALNYLSPVKNQYAYKMEGFDKDWTLSGNKRTATYTNLDPGTYVFKVKASNNDNIWNEEGASLVITIMPPFYLTWWFITVIIMTFMGVVWYVARNNAMKQQRKKLENLVKERTENLQTANDEIKTLYFEIKDSIRAAEVIQRSILPEERLIKESFPESFIFHKPKDVIGGDFYWFGVVKEKIIVAAADCTGHGVSGALMAINGHHLLNRVIYGGETMSASCILDKLNKELIKDLNQQGAFSERNGMDISLCTIDINKKQLDFAGANSPLYIVRSKQLLQVKPDKFSIGMSITGTIEQFSNHSVKLERGDMLYLFTDGYADQISGTGEGMKFMYPRFRKLLGGISREAPERQREILDHTLNSWKGSVEQLDDILVLGFRC